MFKCHFLSLYVNLHMVLFLFRIYIKCSWTLNRGINTSECPKTNSYGFFSFDSSTLLLSGSRNWDVRDVSSLKREVQMNDLYTDTDFILLHLQSLFLQCTLMLWSTLFRKVHFLYFYFVGWCLWKMSFFLRQEFPQSSPDEHEFCHMGSSDDEHPPSLQLLHHIQLVPVYDPRPHGQQHPTCNWEGASNHHSTAKVRNSLGIITLPDIVFDGT